MFRFEIQIWRDSDVPRAERFTATVNDFGLTIFETPVCYTMEQATAVAEEFCLAKGIEWGRIVDCTLGNNQGLGCVLHAVGGV